MWKTTWAATLFLMAFALPAAWAGQFGDYKPQCFLSDYSKLKPEGGDGVRASTPIRRWTLPSTIS